MALKNLSYIRAQIIMEVFWFRGVLYKTYQISLQTRCVVEIPSSPVCPSVHGTLDNQIST